MVRLRIDAHNLVVFIKIERGGALDEHAVVRISWPRKACRTASSSGHEGSAFTVDVLIGHPAGYTCFDLVP